MDHLGSPASMVSASGKLLSIQKIWPRPGLEVIIFTLTKRAAAGTSYSTLGYLIWKYRHHFQTFPSQNGIAFVAQSIYGPPGYPEWHFNCVNKLFPTALAIDPSQPDRILVASNFSTNMWIAIDIYSSMDNDLTYQKLSEIPTDSMIENLGNFALRCQNGGCHDERFERYFTLGPDQPWRR
jgi:hypothetical protein